MIKKQSIIKNYIYQFLYQALLLVIPLILSPYLTRTLQDTSLGVYSYVHSISYYFVVFANLGIGVHGKRAISRASKNETQLRKTFWSLFVVHLVVSVVSTVCYILFIILFVKEDVAVYLVDTAYVVSALFDITWLFYGLENFRSVVIRNAVVKIAECILIFNFVKTPSDIIYYTGICAGGLMIGQLVMIPQAIKIVKPIRFSYDDAKQHFKPLLVFSVALIASSLYTVFDKTLLGFLSTKENVAYYEYSNKIISIPKAFVEIASTVMFPRACKLAMEGKIDAQKKNMEYSFLITAFIGMGSVFGLLAVADLFAVIYFGKSFAICGKVMVAMSPLIYIVGAGKILRSQYLIPNGMDKQFNLCIVYNAVINLVLNCIFIPVLGIYGAIIGSIVAELFGFVYQAVISKKYFNYKIIFTTLSPFILAGFIMFLVLKLVSEYVAQTVSGLIIEVLIGAFVYVVVSGIYLIFFQKDLIHQMLSIVKKRN